MNDDKNDDEIYLEEQQDVVEKDVSTTRGDFIPEPQDEKHFSDEVILLWKDTLKRLYPHMDEGLLTQICNSYQTNPQIFSQLVEEHKNGKHQTAKPRDTRGVYEDAFEILKPEEQEKQISI